MDFNRKIGLSIVLSLTIPILVFVQAIASKNLKFKRWAFTIFIMLYGATMKFSEQYDGYRHKELVDTVYKDLSFKVFITDIVKMLSFQFTQTGASDLYKHVLSYICGTLLGSSWFFFPIVALIYGYLFSGVMIRVLGLIQIRRQGFVFIYLAILFFLFINIEGINTVRTYTALWLVVLGFLEYFITNKKKYLFLVFASPLVHFSFFIIAIPTVLILLFKPAKILVAVIFTLSMFTNIINPGDANETFSDIELAKNKLDSYGRDAKESFNDKIQKQEKNLRWYRKFQKAGVQKWGTNILILVLIFSGVYFKQMNKVETALFSAGILTLALSNLSWFVPALSSRSAALGLEFVLISIILLFKRDQSILKSLWKYPLYIACLFYFPLLVRNLSAILNFPSIFMFFAPFIHWFDTSINFSLKQVLRPIFPF